MKLKLPDRRHYGNNPKGNPNIAEEGRKWRDRTYWKEFLTQISRERSTGPKTYWGKLKSSQNARKYWRWGSLTSKDNLLMDSLRSGRALSLANLLGNDRMVKIIERLMKEIKNCRISRK